MSVYKKDSVIKSYPAYDIVSRDTDSSGYINLTAGDTLNNGLRNYKVGSVVSSALEYNECPIKATERAISNGHGHELQFIFAMGACITAHKQEKKTHLAVDFDATYRFEGKLFKIETAPNDNLRFAPVEA